jgi:hypothetical protein
MCTVVETTSCCAGVELNSAFGLGNALSSSTQAVAAWFRERLRVARPRCSSGGGNPKKNACMAERRLRDPCSRCRTTEVVYRQIRLCPHPNSKL